MGKLDECLRVILREKAIAPGPNGEGSVTLHEPRERGRRPMQVRLIRVPSATTVISLAKESQHAILRKSTAQSWLKICDYVLVDEREDDCSVTMVELKSTLQKRTEGLEQLRRSLPLAEYLMGVCEVELQRSWPRRFNYALIAEKRTNRLDKQRVRLHTDMRIEDYMGIRVFVGVGTRFDFGALAAP